MRWALNAGGELVAFGQRPIGDEGTAQMVDALGSFTAAALEHGVQGGALMHLTGEP
ncbi:hypothetical protein [Streptomyces sp. st140]|uniref:hypothetical protein n=1 Tax=Streptomyces sp. st140 TaxID=1828052 RepID=UPI0015CF2582|nr:hypothetical protein [Streptomyces sp. st140]